MTEDEKRQQKANLLLEYQEAQDNLAQLRERARRKAPPFLQVGEWLKHLGALDPSPKFGEDPSRLGDPIRSNTAEFHRKLSIDEVLTLADEIEQANKLLDDLRARKQELGLR